VQLQFHPASGRAAVRTISIGPAGERLALAVAAFLALLTVSLWITVPAVAGQLERRKEEARTAADSRRAAAEAGAVAGAVADLRGRAIEDADRLNRIAFLYRIPASVWPKALSPEGRFFSDRSPESAVAVLPVLLRALEAGRALLEVRERQEPSAARELPSILPLEETLFEPSAYFGPRRSPWTNSDEFLAGVEIAAARGTAVLSPADGTVAFAGVVRPTAAGSLWQLGSVVVLSHGERGATVYGHLGRIDVRRGERVRRGSRLGLVGSSGWALSPQLHYEFWRPDGSTLRPTDPLFGILDHSLERKPYSLEQMEATWAPGPLEPLPGIGISAEASAAARPAPAHRVHKQRL
jgi:murein DD-endopeptidase MepM/ murein hydrolase activator NlpD